MSDDVRFLYDFNSPYAYLAASRVDEVIGKPVRWQPIAFAFVLRARERTPWSMDSDKRRPGIAECESRAREYGLPPLRWPDDWPVGSYSLLPLRAALVAAEHDRLREFSLLAFRRLFVDGSSLRELGDVLEVAGQARLDPEAVRRRVGSIEIKEQLQSATGDAIARGVYGVPTTIVGERLFWGDDRLADAAAAASA